MTVESLLTAVNLQQLPGKYKLLTKAFNVSIQLSAFSYQPMRYAHALRRAFA
ncbi:hypothetical protein [Moorena sp. SIO2C4]|uniref:hypothetical protein n=1 Tax=Moorena sp. SIO2C4 TaxID=2607824 RepID=UPI000318FA93|nr:hypothetical protein [Moorena sp. SIO2C4]NEQ16087.1 hypothetical protein [Moorena sp. SIO3E2]NES42074.1 hypothetical protein [Moorena sp. SIO2C4]